MDAPPPDSAPWRRLDPALGAALAARVDTLVAGLAAVSAAAVPGSAAADPRFRRNAEEAGRLAVERFIAVLGTAAPALTPELREVYVSIGASEARDRRGQDAFVTALRGSTRLLLREATAALREIGAVTPDDVLVLAEAATTFVDDLVAAGLEGFARQMRDAAGDHDRRRHLAERLLAGGASPDVVLPAAAAVGWTDLQHLVPVLLPDAEVEEARFRFGEDGILTERREGVVALVRASPGDGRDLLGPRLRRPGTVIGPITAWPDLPEAVRLVDLTARLVTDAPGAVRVEDHLVALCLAGEPAALAVLSRRHLAPFADLPAGQRDALLITVESWLRHWGSRASVAEELFVHPQTVSYRIRRARELLGERLDDDRQRLELALVLTRHLGARAVAT